MRFLIGLGLAIAATLILLVDPVRQPPAETVDTVAGCVERYWRGEPVEKWTDTPDMDPVCRSIMHKAPETNR
jgi:hypothetical protein